MTKTRWWLVGAAGAIAAICLAAYFYRLNREADQAANVIAEAMLQGYAAKRVDGDAWRRVSVGMTMQDVERLLGEAPAKRSRPVQQGGDGQVWWEYGYVSSALAPAPNNRAYVVYFARDGRVARLQEPTL